MIAELSPRHLNAIAELCRAEPTILCAWLFGSVAKGTANVSSDVDFAFLLRSSAPQGLQRLGLLDRLARALADILDVSEHDIDVVALNDQGVMFQYEVLRDGRLLFESDVRELALFRWRVWRRYLDFRPTLEIFDRGRRAALLKGHPREHR